MGADAGNMPIVQDNDLVRVHDGAYSLGDDEYCRIKGFFFQRSSQPGVGFKVQRREAVVKHIDFWLSHQGTRDRETLLLATGDIHAALGDHGIKLVLHFLDEFARLRDLSREEHGLLWHKTDFRAQMLLRHLADIEAVNQDAATVDIVKARNQTDQCRFACSGASDDRCGLAWPGAEGNVAEGWLFRARIAESHVLELNISLYLVGPLHLVGILDFRLDGQHFVNSIRRGRSAWEHDEHHRNHEQREENLHGVLQEGDKRADLHLSIIDADSTEPENGNAGKVQTQHHDRHERGHKPVHLDSDIGQIQVGLVEALLLVLLAIKCPDHAHPGEALVQNEIDFIQLCLHGAEQRDGLAHKDHDGDHKHRNDHYQNP